MNDYRQENLHIEVMTPTFRNFGSMTLPTPLPKQVRFSDQKKIDEDSCAQLIDLQDGFRERSNTNSLSVVGVPPQPNRVRSASLSDEYCTPAPVNLAPRDSASSLYEIISSNETGGTLKSCYFSGRDTHFDVDYTTFCGLKLTSEIMRDIFRVGDILYVEQRSPFVKTVDGRGRREWRALDVRSPSAYSPENGTHNFSDDGEHIVWITYGRVKLVSKKKRSYMIIATNVREGLIHADSRSISGHISDYEENVTVLVRAEYRIAPKQLIQIRWCATNVHIVGKVKEGAGTLKQIRIGRSSPFVVVANSFGWLMISREHQAECRSHRRSGDIVKFKACANMPCLKYGTRKSNSVHVWKVLCFMDSQKNAEDVEKEGFDANSTVLPSSVSIANTCNTCQNALVCLCQP